MWIVLIDDQVLRGQLHLGLEEQVHRRAHQLDIFCDIFIPGGRILWESRGHYLAGITFSKYTDLFLGGAYSIGWLSKSLLRFRV